MKKILFGGSRDWSREEVEDKGSSAEDRVCPCGDAGRWANYRNTKIQPAAGSTGGGGGAEQGGGNWLLTHPFYRGHQRYTSTQMHRHTLVFDSARQSEWTKLLSEKRRQISKVKVGIRHCRAFTVDPRLQRGKRGCQQPWDWFRRRCKSGHWSQMSS